VERQRGARDFAVPDEDRFEEPGDVVVPPGDVPGNVISMPGEVIAIPGDVMPSPGEVTAKPGEVRDRPGDVAMPGPWAPRKAEEEAAGPADEGAASGFALGWASEGMPAILRVRRPPVAGSPPRSRASGRGIAGQADRRA